MGDDTSAKWWNPANKIDQRNSPKARPVILPFKYDFQIAKFVKNLKDCKRLGQVEIRFKALRDTPLPCAPILKLIKG
jgi:hypothetical protein